MRLLGGSETEVLVEHRNELDRDVLRAGRLAFTNVRASAEALIVMLTNHVECAGGALGLALREESKVNNLRGCEEHAGAVRAGRYAGATADAGGGLECEVGIDLRDGLCVSIRGGTRVDGNVSASLDDAVEGRPVDDKVLEDWESGRTPGFDRDRVAVLEATHVQLAGRGLLGAVRVAVDDEATLAADAFATVGVERNGFLALCEQVLVEDVQHLQE